ncbi:MAG TPA: sulfotransferase [Rubrobacteraceae bacterium]|nr:sulfotransferase [Rubrobacteraceae bacterium]
MKVIGAGFGRTGTTSLKAALETLGFGPCYHMTEVFAHPRHASTWDAAWRGEPVDWDAFLAGYEATVDWPACTFYRELMEEYPEAKVLLSVRDPERWYESVRSTIYELSESFIRSPVFRAIFGLTSFFAFGGFLRSSWGDMVNEIILQGTFDGRLEDKAYAMWVFERHNEEVKRSVPPDRLLVYEVKESWGPLCEFLGVPEPDAPFPRLNDGAQMQRAIRTIRGLSFALPVTVILVPCAAALALLRRRARP